MADLAALLDKEASAEIEAILSEARTRASEIVAKAEEEAEAIVAGRKRSAQAQHDAALIRARSAAQLEASSMTLQAQHQVVQSVFDEAAKELDALRKDGKRYPKILRTLLEEAVEGVGGGDRVTEVRVHPDDEAAAETAVKALGLDAKVATDATVEGGVRVTAGGNISAENTLHGRLAALRDDLASEVAQTLRKGS